MWQEHTTLALVADPHISGCIHSCTLSSLRFTPIIKYAGMTGQVVPVLDPYLSPLTTIPAALPMPDGERYNCCAARVYKCLFAAVACALKCLFAAVACALGMLLWHAAAQYKC